MRQCLCVSAAVGLRRDEVNLDQARLWVRWLKNGFSVEQPIAGDELRGVRHSCGYYFANKGYDLRLIRTNLGLSRSQVHRPLHPARRQPVEGLWRR
jgi:hypothetical protein